jgi:hypothetical protein
MNVVSGSSQITYGNITSIPTNIVSSSTDSNNIDFTITNGVITADLKGGVVSGSSQITLSSTTGFDTYSGSVSASFAEVIANVGSGVGVSITNLNSFSSSTLSRLTNIETTSASVNSRLTNIETTSASLNISVSNLNAATSSYETNGRGIVSGSSQVTPLLPTGTISGSSQVNLASVTGNSTTNVSEGTNLYYTDARVKTKLNVETVVSGSSQIDITSTTNYTTFSSSVATSISASVAGATWTNLVGKPAGIVSGSSQVVLNDADKTGFSTDDVTEGSNLYYTDVRVKTKLNVETVVSGSSQIDITSTTGFNTFSGSIATSFSIIDGGTY